MVQARRCGGEEMLTHKSIMDARSKCPECDGNGKKYYPSDQYSELNTGWPIVKDNCKTCKGTGNAKVVWTEPIENIIKTPYLIGQVITVICDACGGSGKQTFDLVYDTTIDTVFHRCPICKGKPEREVKVTAISVKNNEFIMEGVEYV